MGGRSRCDCKGHFDVGEPERLFRHRYRQPGELEEIQKATHVSQQAIEELDISYRGLLLSKSSQDLHNRFERLMDLEDLDLGVRACRTHHQNHLTRPARLENLANHFTSQYFKLQELGDLSWHGVSDLGQQPASCELGSAGKTNSPRRIQAEPQRCADCICIRVLHCR